VLLPLSVLNLVVTALIVALGWPWWVSGLFGLVVILIGGIVYYLRRQRGMPRLTPAKEAGLALPGSVHFVHVQPSPPALADNAATAEPVSAGNPS
jgi:hypothetical protein